MADSNRGVFFGYGYAVAVDRLFQMEMLRRTTQGRVAEVLGAEFLPLDSLVRTAYDHRSVRRQLDALPPEQREILRAYAEGFNRRLAEVRANGKLLPVEFGDHGFEPQDWTEHDVAMLFVGSIAHRYSDFNSERDNLRLLRHLEMRHDKSVAWRIFSASKWLLDAASPTTVPRDDAWRPPPPTARPDYLDALPDPAHPGRVALDARGRFDGLTSDPAVAARQRRLIAAQGFSGQPGYIGASNYWAVRGLDDAAAALVNGPQFGFTAPGYVYGIGLHGGDFDVVGNTLLALPTLLFAHNGHIAWGSTAGISDQGDEFALALDPDNPERYRHAGDWQTFESWPELIDIRGRDAVAVTARRASQGMVLDHRPGHGYAWVRARAWEGRELASLMAWVLLATDRSLEAAHARIGEMATNINMYTMDRSGNLGYVHAGRYPARRPGHDPRLPAPGDGRLDWQGLRPYSDNPSVRNPAQGFIANWNNRPRQDWISSDLWTYTWGRADRGDILNDALRELSPRNVASVSAVNRKIAFADVSAPTLLPYLEAAWADARPPTGIVAEALAVLSDWDRQWLADEQGEYGPGPVVMQAWTRRLLEDTVLDDVGPEYFHLYSATNHPTEPLGPSVPNPAGLKALVYNLDALEAGARPVYDFFNGADPGVVLRGSFEAAVATLSDTQGPRVADWRASAQPMTWTPYNFRGVPQARPAAAVSLPAYMNRGSENNLFVATGKGIVGRDVIPPGQSGFAGSAGVSDHLTDQMELFSEFGYKSQPFTRAEIEAAAVRSRRLSLSLPGQ